MSGERDGEQISSLHGPKLSGESVQTQEIDWATQHDIIEEVSGLIADMKSYTHHTDFEWLNSQPQQFRDEYNWRYKRLINEVQRWTSSWEINDNYYVDETTLRRELKETRTPWNEGDESDQD